MKEQGLLLPFQLQDHYIGLSCFFLFRLQGYSQRLVVQLDTLQDGVSGVSPLEKKQVKDVNCWFQAKRHLQTIIIIIII